MSGVNSMLRRLGAATITALGGGTSHLSRAIDPIFKSSATEIYGDLFRLMEADAPKAIKAAPVGALDDLPGDIVPMTLRAPQLPSKAPSIPDLTFTTHDLPGGHFNIIAHSKGAEISDFLEPEGPGIFGYARGGVRGNVAEIANTEVAEIAQGQGLGTELISRLGQEAIGRGATELTSNVIHRRMLQNLLNVFGEGTSTIRPPTQGIQELTAGAHIVPMGVYGESSTDLTKWSANIQSVPKSTKRAILETPPPGAARGLPTSSGRERPLTPDMSIGTGHSSARSGLPRRSSGPPM